VGLRGIDVRAAEYPRLVRRDHRVRERASQLKLPLVPAEVDEIFGDGLHERRPRRALVVDPVADGVEVLDDVVHGQHPQAKPLVLEPGRNGEVVGDELMHAMNLARVR
jgi:hypothetical protein